MHFQFTIFGCDYKIFYSNDKTCQINLVNKDK